MASSRVPHQRVQRPDLDLRRRDVLCERQQDGDGGVQVMRRTHAADVAVQAAQRQRVTGPGDHVPFKTK
jgi:hypothetical protein